MLQCRFGTTYIQVKTSTNSSTFQFHEVSYNLLLVFRYATNEKTTVVHWHAYSKKSTTTNLVVIHLTDCASSIISTCVCYKAIATVWATEIHHESKFINSSTALKCGNKLILITISWNFTNKYFTATLWRWTIPIRWWTILPLSIFLHNMKQETFHISVVPTHFTQDYIGCADIYKHLCNSRFRSFQTFLITLYRMQ